MMHKRSSHHLTLIESTASRIYDDTQPFVLIMIVVYAPLFDHPLSSALYPPSFCLPILSSILSFLTSLSLSLSICSINPIQSLAQVSSLTLTNNRAALGAPVAGDAASASSKVSRRQRRRTQQRSMLRKHIELLRLVPSRTKWRKAFSLSMRK